MREPPTLPWAEVEALARDASTLTWATPRARRQLGWTGARWIDSEVAVPGAQTVIAVGGGAHLDHVKLRWRQTDASRLIAVPTVWGSGAEASPVAVWTEDGQKRFKLDEALRPHAMAFCEVFAVTLSPEQVRAACGDVWAHALEGFLSPLASDGLRSELAEVLRALEALPIAADPRWFPVSARASAGQAESSVGLVHGLAHVLEPRVPGTSHAGLCATFLLPVLRFNASTSEKWATLTAQHGLDAAGILARVGELSSREARQALAPHVSTHWKLVLRDPCTRTNSALVRPDSLSAFLGFLEAT
ncbi:MAG: hypothetical protein AMXMBFR34_40370 [Myxococcaceae bacterium]